MTTNTKLNIVVTGANRGIGLSLTKYYKGMGCSVYAACRSASAELRQTGATVIEGIDVSKAESVSTLIEKTNDLKLDILINNAGILRDERLGSLNYQTIEDQLLTNSLGPLRISEALLPTLKRDSKIAMITSRMGSIADNTSGGRYGYRMSKAALNIASVSLAHDLKHLGISVGIIHPGLVGTDMIGGYGDISPDQAAELIAKRIEELNLENSGTFWHSNGEILPW
jgi:NAD(P)-dependent dehydrogenase (short-subunit alcohol dehydrogenase family)